MRLKHGAAVLAVLATVLAAGCQSQASPVPSTGSTQVPPASAAVPSTAAGGESGAPGGTGSPSAAIGRADTLILGYEGGEAAAPGNANPFIPSFFPQVAAGLHQLYQESLFYVNYETGAIEPWLAESFAFNSDATKLTLKIRPGVTWSDAQPFTASDVAFTLNLLKDNPDLIESGAPGGLATLIASAKATDPATVEIAFTRPSPRYVLEHLSVQIWGAFTVVPEHIWKDQDPHTFLNWDLAKGWPVFTGPYRPTKATSTEFDFERRDDWWGAQTGFKPLPAPKRIIFIDEGPEDRRVAQLANSDVDGEPAIGLGNFRIAQAQNPKLIGWLKDAPYAWVDPCPQTFEFNTLAKPWDDPELRWAVSYSIDKQNLANVTNQGSGLAAKWLFPDYAGLGKLLDGAADVFAQYPTDKADPAKSEAIIQAKGYTKGADGIYRDGSGHKLTMRLLMKSPATGGVDWGIAASEIVGRLNAIGVEVIPTLLADNAYNQAASVGDFDGRMYTVCGSVADPYATLALYTADKARPAGEALQLNVPSGRWKNAEYTDLVDQIGKLVPGDPQIGPLFNKALAIFQRDLPAFALYQQLRVVPYNTTYWTNWPTKDNNYVHPPNWWMSFLQVVTQIKPAK